MSAMKRELERLAGDAQGVLSRAHAWSQARLFAVTVLGAMLLQLQAGQPVAGWAGARSLLAGAVLVAWRETEHRTLHTLLGDVVSAGGLPDAAPAAAVPPDPATAPPHG